MLCRMLAAEQNDISLSTSYMTATFSRDTGLLQSVAKPNAEVSVTNFSGIMMSDAGSEGWYGSGDV